ncbi:hypothetical protein [Rhizobacter sp. OV335]
MRCAVCRTCASMTSPAWRA